METNVNYTVVGAFVLVLLASIILAIIWLSSGFALTRYKTYKVYMTESVSGLTVDAPVEFNGVGVGTVHRIDINQKNPQLVELLLNISNTAPITRGTVATLNTRGFTGITYIALKDKSTDIRPLEAEPGEPYPVIKTAPSLFLRIDTALSQLTKNIRTVADSIQAVLDKENLRSIKQILVNIESVTATLKDNSERMTQIMENTSKASLQLTPLLKSSTHAIRTLEMQTLPGTQRLLNDLQDIAKNLNETAVELRQNPSVLIRGVDREPLGPGEQR